MKQAASRSLLTACFMLAYFSACSSTVKKEEKCSSERLATESTEFYLRRQNPSEPLM
jgi:hypothetical protein